MRATIIALPAILGTLLLGIWLGGHSDWLPGPLRELARDDEVAVVDAAIDRIEDDYYRQVDESKLADDAVRGLVEGLDDPFSAYFDKEEFARFKELSDARFTGIGVTIQKVDDGLRITHVYDDSPAKKAGLRMGDVIVEAAGKDLAGRPAEAASALIKGEAGTEVALRIRRDGELLRKRLTRARVSIPVVESRIVERDGQKLAVIRLETFSSGAHGEVYAAVRRAKKRNVDGIVFDLRGNGGGLVEEARLVASAFLPDGKIVTTRGRSVPERVYRATGDPVAPDIPMVVLVDRGSASAAEIVAGALQDRGRAPLVGTRTFGKGVFQEVVELQNGGALDITVGQYFLPSGRNLGGKGTRKGDGLTPDVRAKDDEDTPKTDEALQRALKRLAAKAS